MRVIYWNTSCLEPEVEAISKEVFQLAQNFRNSLIFGINRNYIFRFSARDRMIGVNPLFDPILRPLIPLLEATCDVNHVYGDPTPWTFYKTLRRKPIVLTVASEKGDIRPDFAANCGKIIVQTDRYRRRIISQGVDPEKVELIYPGVDLSRFTPDQESRSELAGDVTPSVIFATAPRSKEEMEGRGVGLILETARRYSGVNFRLLYRKWRTGHTSYNPTREWIERHGLRNVVLTNSAEQDMAAVYRKHHFTIIPYTTPEGGKECPNSMVEGLACGVPVLLSSVSPFTRFVNDNRCGIVFDPSPESLSQAIQAGMGCYEELSKNAVETANRYFSAESVYQKMEAIYGELL
jgi:glycosyltransferase involved in cell wall biosynthesis